MWNWFFFFFLKIQPIFKQYTLNITVKRYNKLKLFCWHLLSIFFWCLFCCFFFFFTKMVPMKNVPLSFIQRNKECCFLVPKLCNWSLHLSILQDCQYSFINELLLEQLSAFNAAGFFTAADAATLWTIVRYLFMSKAVIFIYISSQNLDVFM